MDAGGAGAQVEVLPFSRESNGAGQGTQSAAPGVLGLDQVKHDTQASIEFLLRWAPEGPWALTAIVPDGKTETRSFSPDTLSEMRSWIESHQGKENLYFSVNPPMKAIASKAKKEDIARLIALHVDIDPRVGEDMDDERHRILKLFEGFSPPPSVVIDSGGGYQGFWRLNPEERLEINGDLSKVEELEAYNIQLEKLFKADPCHNIDRIMRLPGTINVPNARKLKKGRKPALAKLVQWHEDRVYELSDFTPAVRVQTKAEAGLSGGRPKITIGGNVARLTSVEDLKEWNVSEHAMALIVQGEDPIDPTKYQSRSEVLFRVCCELVRATVPDEVIYSVITDPNFEIARSVLEKPNSQKYALRQIERAKEEAVDPWLRRLNERHAVISDMGGKCRIISEVYDSSLKRTRISRQSFEDFRNRYRNQKVQVGTTGEGRPIEKAAGSWWIDHPMRRQYDTIVFAPGREITEAYNLWKGFSCDAIPGNKHEPFLAHLKNNVCSGVEDHYRYLLGWMARAVQQPDCPGETAVVLRGKRGTGKGFAVKVFGSLFGRHYVQVSNSQHLVGNFNAHLRDAVVVFGDEAFFAGDKKHESVLKTLVTEELIVVEGKGVDAEMAPNYTHIMMASNERWVVPAGVDERRFFVLDVGNDRHQDLAYFRELRKTLDSGGLQNLLHFLMNYDISEFEVRRVPQTKALQEQKILSMTSEEQWMLEKLQEGRLLPTQGTWPERVAKDDLYDNYVEEMKAQGRNFRMGRTAFGRFLQSAMPGGYPLSKQQTVDVPIRDRDGFERLVKRRMYFYYLPSLTEMREHWDSQYGGPHSWAVMEDDQVELGSARPEPDPF